MTEDTTALVREDALRLLQLPIHPARAAEVNEAVDGLFADLAPDDAALEIQQALEDWRESGVPGDLLNRLIPVVLQAGLVVDSSPQIVDGYLTWFAKLQTGADDWNGLDDATARRLLSRLPLIEHLLAQEGLSCTQVSRLLHGLESALDVPYQAVQVVARGLGVLPLLNATEAGSALWEADAIRSLALFPDGSLAEACEIAARDAAQFLPDARMQVHFERLTRAHDVTSIRWPYLQILHFCCVPIEFYDHPATYLYEFAPRGQVALALFGRYPAVTGNPILNNAKAVQTLDRAWARNRGGTDAHALVAILDILESVPHTTRRELARLLRAWIQRVIELETVDPVGIPGDLESHEFVRVIDYIAHHETNTQGVLEQRIVDYISILAFDTEGNRSRGIGDSVNASNLSRHKLGDIEFSDVGTRSAIAIEAHGGYLSASYVRDHQRSLARIVKQRLEESWEAIDDPEEWTIRVIFVAHSRDEGLPSGEILHGVRVDYEYLDYPQLIVAARSRHGNIDSYDLFERIVISPLNERTTRQSVRDRFMSIARPAL